MQNSFNPVDKLTPQHIRMARAGLGLTIRELAALSCTNKATIVRIESGQSVRETTLLVIRKTLEDKGACFYVCDDFESVTVKIITDKC